MKSILRLAHPLPQVLRGILWAALLVGIPLLLAVYMLGLKDWDFSIPLIYTNADDIWQLALTKVLKETGWILTNPYLGAPEVANWHHNAAAQTSALHSVLMLTLSPFVQDAVQLQQIYYVLNFPLICLTSFLACRLLGIARLPALCVGLLFSFTSYRIDYMLYAFIPNYFMVPLALVTVIWVISGRFAVQQQEAIGGVQMPWRPLRSREFALGLFFTLLTAVSDGYYAFFTLLLLGFATFIRLLLGDWRRPVSLLPAAIYIFALVAASLLLQLPLQNYKKTHRSEFYPSGILDSALIKHSFEAEVYSSSLKLLIAPIPQHRVGSLNSLGKRMVDTSDAARRFKNHRSVVSLGTLGTLLLAAAFLMIAVPALKKNGTAPLSPEIGASQASLPLGQALLALTLFIFLSSIVGGIGTLVALVFPTIRAYDRFPIFLLFVLYLGAGWFITTRQWGGQFIGKIAWVGVLLAVTAAALYDQTPSNSFKGSEPSKSQFLAERHFVQKVEAALPPNAMVYQYPYSQYLRDSKYYGWGSFSHIRLYLHSQQLRWSNGGAKNSPADDWHFRISQQPLDYLITAVEAAGFSGFVIDRTVVKPAEYEHLHRVFASLGYQIVDDAPSNFTFVRLGDPGFRLVYDTNYREADRIEITDPARITGSNFPRLVEGEAVIRYLSTQAGKFNSVIRKVDHPELFADGAVEIRGSGQEAIAPISDMRGHLGCKREAGPDAGASDTLILTLTNKSAFDWRLNIGAFPIRIGVHIRQPDGTLLSFDHGFRVPTDGYVKRGTSHTIRMPLNSLSMPAESKGRGPLVAEFALMQDGSAWFGEINCAVPLP